jgi:hypothetical protein
MEWLLIGCVSLFILHCRYGFLIRGLRTRIDRHDSRIARHQKWLEDHGWLLGELEKRTYIPDPNNARPEGHDVLFLEDLDERIQQGIKQALHWK